MTIYPGTKWRYFALDYDHDISTDTLKLGLSITTLTETAQYVPTPPARLVALASDPDHAVPAGFTRYWWRLFMGVGQALALYSGNNTVYGQLTDSPELDPHRWDFHLPSFR